MQYTLPEGEINQSTKDYCYAKLGAQPACLALALGNSISPKYLDISPFWPKGEGLKEPLPLQPIKKRQVYTTGYCPGG